MCDAVKEYQACVVGMPVKDTIKISDEEGFAAQTPDRRKVWQERVKHSQVKIVTAFIKHILSDTILSS